MKNNFKVGQVLTSRKTDHMNISGEKFITKGKEYKILEILEDGFTIIDDMGDVNHFNFDDTKYFNNPSLTITIKPSTRNGVKSFRWEFKHANGRKSNHAYNTKASAKKELTKFLDSIKNEDYEIVIK